MEHNHVINTDPPRSARRSGSVSPFNSIYKSKSEHVTRWTVITALGAVMFHQIKKEKEDE